MNRIGNRRGICMTCNAFVQAVKRHAASRLKELHAEDYERMRLAVEMDLYPGVIEKWNLEKGLR
jgi:hypothetical protein